MSALAYAPALATAKDHYVLRTFLYKQAKNFIVHKRKKTHKVHDSNASSV